ncbi:Hypothetical predicted protein [Mytilus galloprovincialis]|uniref:Uncharacterized protein n=2 Tax=Mytilus galloprovincialis TaxID=29158 RepID=A0A8B6GAH0_MYTGA|nr:Hypothetical predicted protein [Mytilus galloprovincialis]
MFGHLYLMILMHAASASVFSNLPGLDRFCSLSDNVIQCNIHVVNFLDFRDIRKLVSDLSGTTVVILNITCGDVGQLRLPWPMKSRNINELWVDGCHVHGFHEFDLSMSDVPDRLVKLKLQNSVIESSVFDTLSIFSKESFDCGQQTLSSLVMRNISYELILEPKDITGLESKGVIMDAGDVLLANKEPSTKMCNYKDLEKIDISNSVDGMTYFILPLQDSEYPKLTLFNMSNNSLLSFPDLMINWEVTFPNLETLDLSANELDYIDFSSSTTASKRHKPLFVNLRNNLFVKVPPIISQLLQRPVPILVDIGDNPLVCGCDTLLYKTYLQSVIKTYPFIEDLQDTTCLQTSGQKTKILELEVNNC